MTTYADLYKLEEDERIRVIGEAAAAGEVVGVCLERDEQAKIERYVQKVLSRFPDVRLVDRRDGPTRLLVTLRFARRADQ